LEGVSFIVSPSAAALSHIKPASAGTYVASFELSDNTKGDILCMLMVARSVANRLERKYKEAIVA